MIITATELDLKVSQCSGTWVKRRNLRNKLTKTSNDSICGKIEEVKGKIRDLRAMGAKEQDLRFWYSEVTQLEVRIL